jgi:3-oxoacyl-[acyl-carrier protein] reductase
MPTSEPDRQPDRLPDRLIDLRGRVALVTGGSRGIGAACCRLLARAGCAVAVNYRRRADAALRVAAEIESMGRAAVTLQADVANPYQVDAMITEAVGTLGGLDILVLSAGIWTEGRIETMTDADWARMIGVNLTGAFQVIRSSVAPMKERGGGAICVIASTAGQRGEAEHSHYAASKGGLIALTRSLAVELAPHGIRVNAVSPGWIRTDMTEPFLTPETIGESLKEPIPLGRPGEAEDVAGPVVFLASELARHITGAVVNVNGGAVLC